MKNEVRLRIKKDFFNFSVDKLLYMWKIYILMKNSCLVLSTFKRKAWMNIQHTKRTFFAFSFKSSSLTRWFKRRHLLIKIYHQIYIQVCSFQCLRDYVYHQTEFSTNLWNPCFIFPVRNEPFLVCCLIYRGYLKPT